MRSLSRAIWTQGFRYRSDAWCWIPFRLALIRNHYVGRTFIEPSQAIRDFGVKLKLNAVRSLLDGKSVVLVDDSLVRGTTSRKIVRMVRKRRRARSPYADLLPTDDLAVFLRRRYTEQERTHRGQHSHRRNPRFIEADSLAYLSMDGSAALRR